MKVIILGLILFILNLMFSIILDGNIFLKIVSVSVTGILIFLLFKYKFIKEESPKEIIKEVFKEKEVFIKEVDLDPAGNPRPVSCLNCTNQLYYLIQALPIMKELTIKSKEYEEEVLTDIFGSFKTIWDESEKIVEDTGKSMESILNYSENDNLTYVNKKSEELLDKFSIFVPEFENMNNLAQNFASVATESFKEVLKTTKLITDLSEQIKVISINVRIEAARVKDAGGFNVLGNDISNFAHTTSTIASEAQKQIDGALTNIISFHKELQAKTTSVKNMADGIYSDIKPFPSILQNSSDTIKKVIKKLHFVSNDLNENLKNTISKLQYQDMTSQEGAHIIQIIERYQGFEIFQRDFDVYLSKEDIDTINTTLIDSIYEICTTATEYKVAKYFAKKYGVEITKIKDQNYSLAETANEDDDIMLF